MTVASSRTPGRQFHLDLGFVTRAVVFIGAIAIGLQQLNDNSFFTHLATGRLILDGGIPSVDPYSFTAPGEPWVVQSWLPSALYGIADQVGGGYGLLALNAALISSLVAIVWMLYAPAEHIAVRFGLTAVSLFVAAGTWTERPFLFGLICLGLTLLIIERSFDPRFLVPIFWIWVNSHGSFPIGLGLIVAWALGRWLDEEERPRELRYLGWAIGGTLLGGINPLGPTLLIFPLELLGKNEQLQFIQEWRSPAFRSTVQRAFLALMAISIFMVRRTPSWRFTITLVGVTIATMISVRNMAIAPVALAPVLAVAAHRDGDSLAERRSLPISAGAIVVVLLAGAMLMVGFSREPFRYRAYPLAAMSWMQERGLLEDNRRVVAPDIVGNLREAMSPEVPVFIDDRVDMFPADVVDSAVVLLDGGSRWENVLDDVEAEAVLWQAGRPLSGLLAASSRWDIVYSDMQWVVALRAS